MFNVNLNILYNILNNAKGHLGNDQAPLKKNGITTSDGRIIDILMFQGK